MTIKTGEVIIAADFVQAMTAGEALSARDAVYLKVSDGKVYKCDADDSDKLGFIGFAQEAASLDGTVNIILNGIATGFSGLTAGSHYFASGTAGAITATAPANPVVVGIALSASVIKIVHAASYQFFSGSGTWYKPPFGSVALVKLWAGGGGGGKTGGGGGGEYIEKWFDLSDFAASVTVTIGAGGGGSSTDASNGGDTTFGAHLTADHGDGGQNVSGNDGTGGNGGGLYGGGGGTTAPTAGADGKFGHAGGGGGGGNNSSAGDGGDSLYGGGGGGGGAASQAGGTSTYGGNGGLGGELSHTAGSVPSGGGGGTKDSGSGSNGAAGQALIIVF